MAVQAPLAKQTEPQIRSLQAGKRQWVVGTLVYTATGLAGLFLWLLLGDFSWNMKDKAIGQICLIMLRGFDTPDWLVGLLMGSIPAAIGLLLGPIIGVWSDRFRSRWGRRIPFILAATPFILITMLGLSVSPNIGQWLHQRIGPEHVSLNACRIAAFAFFWTTLDIAAVVANSLYGALVNDVVPREVIGRFYGLFRCVGLSAGMIFFFGFMGKVQAHAQAMLAALGLLYGACFILMCLRVKEGHYPLPPPNLGVRSPIETLRPVGRFLKECYGHPFFLSFFLVTVLGGFALAPVNTFAVYHSRSINMSDDLYGRCVGWSYLCSFLLAYPLGILADRIHPLRLGLITMALYALSTAFGFFFAFSARSFFVAFALHTVISGSYITATASIAQRLLPRSKFAEISAAGGIIGALLGMFVGPALGAFIQWRHHEYRYTFLLACALAILTCFSYLLLLHQYNKRGGDRSFVSPESGNTGSENVARLSGR